MHHSELYYFLTIMTFCVGHQLTETEQQNLNNNNMDSMKERDLHSKEKSSNDENFIEPTSQPIKTIGVSTLSWENVSATEITQSRHSSLSSTSFTPEKPTMESTAIITMMAETKAQQMPSENLQTNHNRTDFIEANKKHRSSILSKPTLATIRGLPKNHKSEAPILNHIFDSHPIFSKHYHHDFRYGPHFENDNITNITVQVGNTLYLNCRISLLQDKTVSWVQRRQGENELQLLTVGKQTYSGDPRYQIEFQYPNNWKLKIVSAIKEDEGVYECQVSTHPPRIITYNLHINAAPEVTIIDEQGIPLLDKYYEVDSTIRLMCIVRHVSMLSSVVYWSHGDSILNFDVSRGGISVKTDLMEEGANSTLFVARINKSDSGNYSCSIASSNQYTVTVHVLNEESLAELHHSCALYSWLHHQQQIYQNVCITIVLIVFYLFNFAVR